MMATFAIDDSKGKAMAEEKNGNLIASGECGTCVWTIDASGHLLVAPKEGGVGELAEWAEVFGGEDSVPWGAYDKDVVSASFAGTVKAPTCKGMFRHFESLESLDLSGLDTSRVRDMSWMFVGCKSLTGLDLSPLDTSKATDMSWMFRDCSSLTSLSLNGLNTSKVRAMSSMFNGCSSLTSLDLTGVDTSLVKYMGHMFAGCSSLASIDLSPLDTSLAVDMHIMFKDCASLTSLDLSGFDTASAKAMQGMFSGCSSLREVFAGSLWAMDSVEKSEDMFAGCEALVGGNGTAYDPDRVDGEYARVDADGAPGYFTAGQSDSASPCGAEKIDNRNELSFRFEVFIDDGGDGRYETWTSTGLREARADLAEILDFAEGNEDAQIADEVSVFDESRHEMADVWFCDTIEEMVAAYDAGEWI